MVPDTGIPALHICSNLSLARRTHSTPKHRDNLPIAPALRDWNDCNNVRRRSSHLRSSNVSCKSQSFSSFRLALVYNIRKLNCETPSKNVDTSSPVTALKGRCANEIRRRILALVLRRQAIFPEEFVSDIFVINGTGYPERSEEPMDLCASHCALGSGFVRSR